MEDVGTIRIKASSNQTIVHAIGNDIQGFVVVDRVPGRLDECGSVRSTVSSQYSV